MDNGPQAKVRRPWSVIKMNKIRKGDTVKVLRGEDAGKTGVVNRVLPKEDRVIVAGVNLIKKAQRRTMNVRTQAGIIEREDPIHISKVAVICKNCGKPTRVGFAFSEDGRKHRICKKCGEELE